MFSERTSVGLDVHARSVVAAAIDGVTGEVFRARLSPGHGEVIGWLRSLPGPCAVAYEAGPTGFGLARAVTAVGIRCEVAAPSKLQRPCGDRVKTDARDAMHLARLLRMDEVTCVGVPTPEQEDARDLVRAREDCRGDLMRDRHRLSKLLLRQGIVYSGGQAWTGAHEAWLRSQRFARPGVQLAFDAAHEAALMTLARRDRLDAAVQAMAADSEFTPVVRRLSCLRGVSTLTAFALAVEIGDWHRFTGASIGSFVGLVPSEFSSGASRVQGPITKTGNSHARRLLVEAAWHHRARYQPGAVMLSRWNQAPAAARARGDQGNRRLHPLGHLHPAAQAPRRGQCRRRPRARRVVLVPGGHGRVTATTNRLVDPGQGGSAWSDPRSSYEQQQDPDPEATLDPRHAEPLQPNSPSCGNQPAHISCCRPRFLRNAKPPANGERIQSQSTKAGELGDPVRVGVEVDKFTATAC